MDKDTILNMDIIERIDYYQTLNELEKLRFHLMFDCNCGVPSCYYDSPIEHMSHCPMYNPNNPNYDYM